MTYLLLLLALAADAPRVEETIVVTAERLEQPAREATAAVTVLEGEDLPPASDAGEALRLVQGLQLVNVNPGAPPMVGSRGFFGAGEVEYVQLVVDGMPMSDVESGLADWRAIPTEAIEHIEVVRGAGSSLFGDTALGGVVQVFRRAGSYASFSAGSFGSKRVAGGWAEGPWAVRATFQESDGFREHGNSRELFANAGLTRGSWRASLDLSDRDRDDPSFLSAEELEADRFGSNELFRFDGEETRRIRGALRYEGAVDLLLHANARQGETVRTLLLFPGFGDRAMRRLDTLSGGATASRTIERDAVRVAGGVDLAHESLRSRYFAFDEAKGDELADGSGHRRRGAAYVTGEWRVTPAIRLAAGARFDAIDDSFESIDARDDAFSPRLGASFDLGPVTAYAQFARAFKAPTLDQRFDQRPLPDFQGGTFTISNPRLVPQRSKNAEAGLRGGRWDVAAYLIDVDNEIDFDVATFRYANIGRSRHRGIEALVTPVDALRVAYAWTRVEAREGDNRGRQLKNIAEHVLRADAAWRMVHVAVEHASGRFLDDANEVPLDDTTLVDLRLTHDLGPLTLSGEVRNLFDDDYAPLGLLLAGTPYYYPAAGRSYAVTLTWKGASP